MAKPSIDISSQRGRLDEDFKNGKLSPREYRRLQTGMGNISYGQNQGYGYKIDPGTRSFSAEKNGVQAKGKIGGTTLFNPLSGRKTSKAIEYINSNQSSSNQTPTASGTPNAGSETKTSTPTATSNATVATKTPETKASRYNMPGNPSATVGKAVRMDPKNTQYKQFDSPSFKSNSSMTGNRFLFSLPSKKGKTEEKTKTDVSPQKTSSKPTVTSDQVFVAKPFSTSVVDPLRTPKFSDNFSDKVQIKPQAPSSPIVASPVAVIPPSAVIPALTRAVQVSPQQQNPVAQKTESGMGKTIQDYYERIALARRNPTNRAFDDDRRNLNYYQTKIEELKSEFYKNFGKNYGSRMDLNQGYVRPGIPSINLKRAVKTKSSNISKEADYYPLPIESKPFNPSQVDPYGNKLIKKFRNGNEITTTKKFGFDNILKGFDQSGRGMSMDIDSALNTGMGLYGAGMALSNKSPTVPDFTKARFRIRPGSGDYDSLQRNLNAADSSYSSMRNTLRDNVGSDRTTYIRSLLGAGQFRNQAQMQAVNTDAGIRIQDRQREDAMKMAEDQYNIQGINQQSQQKFGWDAQRWQTRNAGAQAMVNSSLNFGAQKRANMYNNEMAEKSANKQLTFLETNMRSQLWQEFIRNNGGRQPTEQEFSEILKRVAPNEDNPSIFN